MASEVAQPNGPAPAGPWRRAAGALGWVVLVVAVAVAGAGLVVALDHPRTEIGRPELTAVAHARLAPRLRALGPALDDLAVRTRQLSTAGRDVLGSLRRLDATAASAALDSGTLTSTGLAPAVDALGVGRATLLEGIDPARLRAADTGRISDIDAAIEGAGAVAPAWTTIEAVARSPVDLIETLRQHDQHVIRAAAAGRQDRWPDALALLDRAARSLAVADGIRADADRRGLDVATLTDWLSRSADYDRALTALYTALRDSGGVRTPVVEALLGVVEEAEAALPTDQNGLVVAVSDLATMEVTSALLRIEDARAALDAAAGTLD